MTNKGESGFTGQTSRGELVYARLRDAIRDGRYAPGSRVRETEVAKWLGVSRTPVREALRRLQTDGLLVFEPWRGVVVATLDHQQVVELYAVRQALEGAAARLAAQHASDSEIAHMAEQLNLAPPDKVTDPVLLATANREFHQALYQGAHNRYLLTALNSLRDSLAMLKGTTYTQSGRAHQAQKEHEALMAAIRARDPDKAEQLARRHIANAERARIKVQAQIEKEEVEEQ